jgi:hypothetical protein
MVNLFLRVMVFTWFFLSTFFICLMILHMPIPKMFFPNFPTFQHGDLIIILSKLGTWQRDPLRRTLFVLTHLCAFCLNSSPPRLCFPFLGRWYTYKKSCIKCGSYVFTIVGKVIDIRSFSAISKVCSLVSLGVGPSYIISFWLFYSQFKFFYFGCIDGIHIIC